LCADDQIVKVPIDRRIVRCDTAECGDGILAFFASAEVEFAGERKGAI
jgi:hypothetical protein